MIITMAERREILKLQKMTDIIINIKIKTKK